MFKQLYVHTYMHAYINTRTFVHAYTHTHTLLYRCDDSFDCNLTKHLTHSFAFPLSLLQKTNQLQQLDETIVRKSPQCKFRMSCEYTHTHTHVHYIFMAVYVCVSSVWETKHMINELLILLGPNKGYDFPLPPSPCCHVIIIVVVPLPPPLGLRASALLSSIHLLATMPQTNCMKMKTLHDARVQGRNKMLWAKLCGKTATGQNNDRKRWRIKQNTKSNNNKNKGHF